MSTEAISTLAPAQQHSQGGWRYTPGRTAAPRRLAAQHLIPIVFAICVLGVSALGGFAFYLFARSEQSDALMLDNAVAIARLERFHLTLVEAESAGRAFLVAIKPHFKASYTLTTARIDDEFHALQVASSGDAEEQKLLGELEQNIARRFAFLEAAMRVRAEQDLDTMLRTSVGPGIREMQVIKLRIERLKAIANDRLAYQQGIQRDRDAQLKAAIWLLATIGLGVLGALFWHMQRLWFALARTREIAVHAAHHDALTGVPNRRLLQDRLAVAISAASRQEAQMAVLSMDLDGFKHINDAYGHDVGDALLIEVAARLAKLMRAQDTVARMGGDEFVISLFSPTASAEAHIVARRILETVSSDYSIGGRTLRIGASIGAAIFPADGINAAALLKVADTRLYDAKRRRLQAA